MQEREGKFASELSYRSDDQSQGNTGNQCGAAVRLLDLS